MNRNTELELAYKFTQYTSRNIFLTGKAGTGKTSFLKSLKHKSIKRMLVLAPTGVAAINAGGVTIHSFFQLPFGPILTEKVAGHKIERPGFKYKFSKIKINIIKTLDLLVIDEISMVRADVLDAVDEVLRRYKNKNLPFGGLQLLLIGDLQQLAPVVKNAEYKILSPYYKSMYFFNSKALQESEMITLELKQIYRQKDETFLNILNEIRNDQLSTGSYKLLHKRYIPNFEAKDNEGYITLTTHNNSADRINENKLHKINKPLQKFEALTEGTFSESSYPAKYELELKVGAQVMYIKNDSSPEKRYYNGKIGTIRGFEDDFIIVKCEGDPEDIYTGKEKWENIKYNINKETKEIEEESVGFFIQYPLRLAWAVTIHKSQGLTFDKAIIDAASAFTHGQTYVALSRCKTLEGLVLSSKISEDAVICDTEINEFNQLIEKNQPDEMKLKEAVYAYQKDLITELFNYRQLKYRFDRFEKVLREHAQTYTGNIGETVYDIQKNALPKITDISQNFIKQINNLMRTDQDAENNQQIQERLEKAAEYFIKFHEESIIRNLENSRFETDNATVNKEIRESSVYVKELLNVKQNCLNVCLLGFNMKDFLDARAKALLDDSDKTKKSKVKFKETEVKHPELYDLLKKWRKKEAGLANVPLYIVAANKVLHAVSNKLPVTLNQLNALPGIGKKKSERYGDAIISMVTDYLKANDIEADKDTQIPAKINKKKNWEISYEMYKAGKSFEEIAKAQGFVVQTIENHLSRYIASGDIKIEELVDAKKLGKISDYFRKHPNALLSEVKASLPEDISYSQIKFVQKYLEISNK